jgi:hypothetical protein
MLACREPRWGVATRVDPAGPSGPGAGGEFPDLRVRRSVSRNVFEVAVAAMWGQAPPGGGPKGPGVMARRRRRIRRVVHGGGLAVRGGRAGLW